MNNDFDSNGVSYTVLPCTKSKPCLVNNYKKSYLGFYVKKQEVCRET